MIRLAAWLAGLVILFAATRANAHGFAPRVVELRERGEGRWDMELRGAGDTGAPPEVHLPASCTELSADGDRARVELRCAELRGAELWASGVDSRSELLVQVRFLDGTSAHGALQSEADRFVVPRPRESPSALGAWIVLGARHIASGFDHLLFIAALFFLVRSRSHLVAALTAFTVAHSLTLALGVLGVARLSPALAEALIALSVACLAAELARRRQPEKTFSARHPWLVAFAFGLLHGTGFASGLGDAGIAAGGVARALFGFNVGVELGQIGFVALLVGATVVLRRIPAARVLARPRVFGYACGSLAAAWTIERVGAMFS